MSFAALTQPNVAEMVEAAALLCPISYLGHVTAPLVERMVFMHLDQVGTLGARIYLKKRFQRDQVNTILVLFTDGCCSWAASNKL